jgi:Flp pilus assembly pilin Flp
MKTILFLYLVDEDGSASVEYALILLVTLSMVNMANKAIKPQISNLLANIDRKTIAGLNAIY